MSAPGTISDAASSKGDGPSYDTLDGGPPPFLPSISDFWHPSSSPAFEASLSGWSLWFYRLLRKIFVYLFLLIRALLVICRFPYLPSRPTWTTRQKIVIPFLNHSMWARRGLGLPPEESFDGRRDLPLSVEKKHGGYRKEDQHMVTAEQLDLPLMTADRQKRWLLPASEGGVLDPTGVVKPERVPCYSFWREPLEQGGTGFSISRPGERVICYLIGGGYVEGSPIEERVWNVCRKTGLRVIGAPLRPQKVRKLMASCFLAPNFRKATDPSRAFPAALQDALLVRSSLSDLNSS